MVDRKTQSEKGASEQLNELLIKVADKYQNIKYKDINVPVPYFINTAEQVYKQAMRDVGIEDETIKKIVQSVKDRKTPLGSGGGKGSPEEITQSLERLMNHLSKEGYHPQKPVHVRKWMVEMHIGLDCSGYIYNILDSIEKNKGIEILRHLAWTNPETMKPSHAGTYIFDSENLDEISSYGDLKPLDLFIRKDHIHVGILAVYKGHLCLTDCSMENNGISFSKVGLEGNLLIIEHNESWNKMLKKDEVIIRRINS